MKLSVQILLGVACYAAGSTAQTIVVKPRQVLSETAGILAADLEEIGAQIPPCNGTVDLLPVTFTFPVVGAPVPEDFRVDVGALDGEVISSVTPSCAALLAFSEPNELRSVLLGGEFKPSEGLGPISVTVVGNLSLDVNGDVRSVTDSSISSADFFSASSGPRVIDFEIRDPTSPANNSTADPNGCAAIFPNTTYTLRLLFSAGVRQLSNGTLAPLGTNGTAATAAKFFSLSAFGVVNGTEEEPRAEPDELLGIADVDSDNVVDLCVRSVVPLEEGQRTLLRVNCGTVRVAGGGAADAAGVIFDPSTDPCGPQTVLLSSEAGGTASLESASESAPARMSGSSMSRSSSSSSSGSSAGQDASAADTERNSSQGEGGRTATTAATSTMVL